MFVRKIHWKFWWSSRRRWKMVWIRPWLSKSCTVYYLWLLTLIVDCSKNRWTHSGVKRNTTRNEMLTTRPLMHEELEHEELEALEQGIPPPRHVLPVLRYGFGSMIWNAAKILIICSLAHCQPSLKISCKSVWKFLRKVANKHTDRQTDRQTHKQRWLHPPWRRQ